MCRVATAIIMTIWWHRVHNLGGDHVTTESWIEGPYLDLNVKPTTAIC